MKTKAQGLPLNTIILAAIGLVVLFALMYIFSSSSSIFSKTTLSCDSKGGQCMDPNDCNGQKTDFKCPDTKQKNTNQVCCINA